MRERTSSDALVRAVTSRHTGFDAEISGVAEDSRAQLLALRGLLGHRTLEHCLVKRYNVDYGTTMRNFIPYSHY